MLSSIKRIIFQKGHKSDAQNLIKLRGKLLRIISDAHTPNPGTSNFFNQLDDGIHIAQIKVADEGGVKQHLVKVFAGEVLFMYADFSDFKSPIFYDFADDKLTENKGGTLDFYLSQII